MIWASFSRTEINLHNIKVFCNSNPEKKTPPSMSKYFRASRPSGSEGNDTRGGSPGGRASPAPPPPPRFLGKLKAAIPFGKSHKSTPKLASQPPASHLQPHAGAVSAVSLVSTISALSVVGGGAETGTAPDGSPALCAHEPQPDSTMPSIAPALEGKNVKDPCSPSQDTTSRATQINSDPASGTENPSQPSRESPESTKEKLIQAKLAAIWKKTLAIANQKLIDNNLPPLDVENLKSQSAEENMQSVIRKLETAHAENKTTQWRYSWRGREIIVIERLGKILRGVQKYAPIVDTAIQHSPEVTALVWGGAKAILQVRTFTWDSAAAMRLYILDRSLSIIWKPLNVLKQQR